VKNGFNEKNSKKSSHLCNDDVMMMIEYGTFFKDFKGEKLGKKRPFQGYGEKNWV
jgi:hypothetical protein